MQGIDTYAHLTRVLNYQFSNISLLEQALTHRSAGKNHNERLEFLGDAVLGMVVADALFQKFPQVPEGKLTRMRSTLVKGETLAELGREAKVGDLLKLGQGELKSGGHRRGSILADAVEAILGAIYLDAGLETVRAVILTLWEKRIDALDPNEHPKDSKTRLQEYLQSRREALPVYDVVNISGKDHAQVFEISCMVNQLDEPMIGTGNSRRKAEQEAARMALEKLEDAGK
ncbi:ribonuclease III [Alteromonas pelagimontana]|uniref:Ribonuclease 3 n=1 Tax=Alteromonas pelagimontana TaxID=1858656 RepID=A0A6M4MGS4_9ALTE|nr:ribonuclease III [Alteromonas pelagimontana]QJR82098.1 ribonuclease III [Alteromonas pelagimontana]